MTDAARRVLGWVDNLVPPVPAPVTNACGTINQAWGQVSAWTWMVPWPSLLAAAGILTAGIIAAIAIRSGLVTWSMATGGGGT